MESALKKITLTLDLNQAEKILNAVAHHFNYINGKTLIDEITSQISNQVSEEDSDGSSNNN